MGLGWRYHRVCQPGAMQLGGGGVAGVAGTHGWRWGRSTEWSSFAAFQLALGKAWEGDLPFSHMHLCSPANVCQHKHRHSSINHPVIISRDGEHNVRLPLARLGPIEPWRRLFRGLASSHSVHLSTTFRESLKGRLVIEPALSPNLEPRRTGPVRVDAPVRARACCR